MFMSYNTIVVIDKIFVKKRNVLMFVDSILKFRVIAFFIIKYRKFVFNELIIYNHRYICVLIKVTFKFIFFKQHKYIIIMLKIIMKIIIKIVTRKIIIKWRRIVIIKISNILTIFLNDVEICSMNWKST